MKKRRKSPSGSAREAERAANRATAARAAAERGDGAVVDGRFVAYPVVVREAASSSVTWTVDARVARDLLPSDDLELAEILPGRALLSIACIDYVDNDLGDYNEVSIALFVRPRGAPRGLPYLGTALDFLRARLGTYIVWLPVDQAFTREAGETMWGFPKTVETIQFDHHGSKAVCRLTARGRHVLTLTTPRGGSREIPASAMTTYTVMDEGTAATRFTSRAKGVGFFRSGVELELGDHPMAATLRELGLPKKPLMAVWMEHMRATFERAQPL